MIYRTIVIIWMLKSEVTNVFAYTYINTALYLYIR